MVGRHQRLIFFSCVVESPKVIDSHWFVGKKYIPPSDLAWDSMVEGIFLITKWAVKSSLTFVPTRGTHPPLYNSNIHTFPAVASSWVLKRTFCSYWIMQSLPCYHSLLVLGGISSQNPAGSPTSTAHPNVHWVSQWDPGRYDLVWSESGTGRWVKKRCDGCWWISSMVVFFRINQILESWGALRWL